MTFVRQSFSGLERTTCIRGVRCADGSIHRFRSTALRGSIFRVYNDKQVTVRIYNLLL